MLSIHRVVLRRLLMAWAAVSLLVGIPTYYVELRQLDDSVLALAASESRHFAPAGLHGDAHSPEELRTLEQRANEFVQRNFVVIEVYDRNKRRLLEAVNPQFEHIEDELKRFKHSFPNDTDSHFEKFVLGEDTIVQVLLPLRTEAGNNGGYFEGVFVVDPDTLAELRSHVALGVDIVEQSDWLQGARAVIEGHHEKFDGSGYPRALAGSQIPLNARIFAIVDVFDALTSRRPYKEPMPLAQALAIIGQDAGSHFDPQLVERFLDIAPGLHASIAGAGEAALQALLRDQAMHYFLRASIEAGGRPQTA